MTAPVGTSALDALAEARSFSRCAKGQGDALRWALLPVQRKAFDAFTRTTYANFVVLCSRRWGKTRFACLLVWMKALSHPNAIIRYACPTKVHGRKYVIPAMKWVQSMAPAHLRPKFNAQDSVWTWPNGSVCHLGSCETDADVDAQVGTECHLAVVDESGKIRSHLLRKLLKSAIGPQFLTVKGGRCIVTGTPPDSPDHYFRDMVTQATERGSLVEHTIDDCRHVNAEALAELIAEYEGGIASTEAQRELYVKFVTEEFRAVVPEFSKHKEHIVKPVAPPEIADRYVSFDFGFNDLSFGVYGYLDFDRAKLCIQAETVMRGRSSMDVGDECKRVERDLWHGASPLVRVADAPLQLIADVAQGSGVHFRPAMKYDSDASLNMMRRKIAQHRIEIDPSCKTLIAHLEYAIWNARKTDMERMEDHHFDGVPALKYMVRQIDWTRMPAPPKLKRGDDIFVLRDRSNDLATQLRRRD